MVEKIDILPLIIEHVRTEKVENKGWPCVRVWGVRVCVSWCVWCAYHPNLVSCHFLI